MQVTSPPFWLMMVSRAIAVLPVWRSPMISSRCPRPMANMESIALMPVCMGAVTPWRRSTPGAIRSSGMMSAVSMGPLPSIGCPRGSRMRPITASTAGARPPRGAEDAPTPPPPRRHLGDPPRGTDGVPLLEMVGRAQDDGADAVLAKVQCQPEDRALAVGAGEGEELAGHRLFQAVDPGDAVADRRHHALARLHHSGVEARDASLQDVADLVASYCHRSVCP